LKHSSHSSIGSRPKLVPKPSKLYLELKNKYDIKTEYLKEYTSRNWKAQQSQVIRLYLRIIEEKVDDKNGIIAHEIYKSCLDRLYGPIHPAIKDHTYSGIPSRYELRFLCTAADIIRKVNSELAESIWSDILDCEKISRRSYNDKYALIKYDPDWCEGIHRMIDIAYKLKKVKKNEEKQYLISVMKIALESCHSMDFENLSELLNKIEIKL